MAKKAEATLTIKIKQQGEKVLTGIKKGLSNMIPSVKQVAIGITALGVAMGKLALDAARFEDVEKKFKKLADSQGVNAGNMLANMKALTKGTISELELMKKANTAILLGLPIDRFDEMLQIALGAAQATGESSEFMLNSLVVALGRGSKLMLDNLGILIDVEKAQEEYAASMGKTSAQLSDTEKKQAFINKALEIGNRNLEAMGGVQESVAIKWERFKATLQDNAIVLGKNLTPAFEVFVDLLGQGADAFGKFAQSDLAIDLFEEMAVGVNAAAQALRNYLSEVEEKPSQGFWATQRDILNAYMNPVTVGAPMLKKYFKEREETAKKEAKLAKETIEGENAIRVKFDKLRVDREQKARDDAKAAEQRKFDEINRIDFERGNERLRKHDQDIDRRFDSELESVKKLDAMKLAQLKSFKDNEKKLFIQHEQEALQRIPNLSNEIESFLSTGIEGVARRGVTAFAETLLPGIGGAAGAVFDLLAQDADDFAAQLDQMFSVDFLGNIFANLTTLVEKVPELVTALIESFDEQAPAMTESFTAAMVASAPDIIASLAKGVADPKFAAQLAKSIAKGFIDGAKLAVKDVAKAMEEATKTGAKSGFRVVAGVATGGQSEVAIQTAEQLSGGASLTGTISPLAGITAAMRSMADIGSAGAAQAEIAELQASVLQMAQLAILAEALGDPSLVAGLPGGKEAGAFTDIFAQMGFAEEDVDNDVVSGFFSRGRRFRGHQAKAHGGLVKGYALGGLIDNTLIAATPGEMVVNKASTQANLGLLEAINGSNGRSVGGGNTINITVNGGMLGDRNEAKQFAKAVDDELFQLRQGRESRAFDEGLF